LFFFIKFIVEYILFPVSRIC